MTIATRLFSNGSYLVSGSFDEVTQSTISVTGNTVYASLLDEVTNNGSTPQKRDNSNGCIQVSGIFDEFTGAIVVDSSLSLWLDAGQYASYPGTGTTWTDLSGKANHGTLQNSPTFNQFNPVSFSFDSTSSEYVSTTTQYTNPQTFSIGIVFKTTTTAAKKLIGFEQNQTGQSSISFDRHLYIHTDGYLKFGVYGTVSGVIANTNYSVADGNWKYAVGTFTNATGIATLYLNGDFVASGSLTGGSAENTNGWWRIASYRLGGVWGGTSGYYNGDIAIAHIYDRALSANEIKVNFNGIRKRFGL